MNTEQLESFPAESEESRIAREAAEAEWVTGQLVHALQVNTGIPTADAVAHTQDFLGFMGKLVELMESSRPSPGKMAALLGMCEGMNVEKMAPDQLQVVVTLCEARKQLARGAPQTQKS